MEIINVITAQYVASVEAIHAAIISASNWAQSVVPSAAGTIDIAALVAIMVVSFWPLFVALLTLSISAHLSYLRTMRRIRSRVARCQGCRICQPAPFIMPQAS